MNCEDYLQKIYILYSMKMNKRNNCFEEFFKVEFDEGRIILDDYRNIEDYYCCIFSKKCEGIILKMLIHIFDEMDEGNFRYLFRCVNFIFSVSENALYRYGIDIGCDLENLVRNFDRIDDYNEQLRMYNYMKSHVFRNL